MEGNSGQKCNLIAPCIPLDRTFLPFDRTSIPLDRIFLPFDRTSIALDRTFLPFDRTFMGDPKSRNDGTAEWRNGGMAEWRNHGTAENNRDPKRRNRGMAERRILKDGIAERRNDGKYPEILKDGMTENAPKS